MGPAGQHKGVWSDDACVATNLKLRHGLLWNLVVLLADINFGCRIGRNGLHGDGVVALSHRRACAGVCAFLRWAWCALKQLSSACRCVHPRMFLTWPYMSAIQSLEGVHMCSCVRSLFIRVGDEGETSLCRALVAWRMFWFLIEGEMKLSSCVFLFLTQACVYVCVCVCVRTLTHTLHMKCLMSGQDRRMQIQ